MSEIMDNMHELAQSLHQVGAVDEINMKVMDGLCLLKARQFSPDELSVIRRKTRMSQPAFATFLNVSPSSVVQWKGGINRLSGPATRLLDLSDRKGV